jgi:hypothetical protein
MARVGTITQRLIESVYDPGQGNLGYSSGQSFVTAAGERLMVSNNAIRKYETSASWLAAPTGYDFDLAYYGCCCYLNGNKLYIIARDNASDDVRLYYVDILAKSYTTLKSWSGSSSPCYGWLVGSLQGGATHIAIGVRTSSAGTSIESLRLSDDTITVLESGFGTEYSTPEGGYVGTPRVGEDNYLYFSTYISTATTDRYLYKASLTTVAWPTVIDSNTSSRKYIPFTNGYHIRSDYPLRVYNEARSSYWTMPDTVYGGVRIGNQGSDGAWLMHMYDGMYAVVLDTSGSVTRTRVGPFMNPGTNYGPNGSSGRFLPYEAYDATHPGKFFISVNHDSVPHLLDFYTGRSEIT